MKDFWKVGLSCVIWSCLGLGNVACATPYTFDDTSTNNRTPNSASNDRENARQQFVPDRMRNSAFPKALTGITESTTTGAGAGHSSQSQSAFPSAFMKEDGPGGQEFSSNGASITSIPIYRGSSQLQSQPIDAEQWAGNRMRGQNSNFDLANIRRKFRNRNLRNRNFQSADLQSANAPNSNVNFFGGGGNNSNNNGINRSFPNDFNNFTNNVFRNAILNNAGNQPKRNPDPTVDDNPMRHPDRVANTPQVDEDGVRHFSNGKHMDLSKMSLDDAIGATNAAAPARRNRGRGDNAMP